MSIWATALMFIRRIFCRRNIKYHITHSAFVYPLFFDTRIDSQSIKLKMQMHIYLVSVIILQRILSPCSLWAARSMTTMFFFFFDFPRNNLFCVCANADWWIMQTAIHPFLFFCEKIPSQWATVSSGGSPQYRPQRTPSEVDNKKRTLSWEPSTKWFLQEILFNLSKPTNYLFLYPGWSSSAPSPVIIPTNHPIVPRTLLKHRPISPGAMKWTDPVSFTDTDTTRYLFRPVWSSSDPLLQSTFCHCPAAFWCHPGSFRHNIHSSNPGALKGSHSIPHSFAAL